MEIFNFEVLDDKTLRQGNTIYELSEDINSLKHNVSIEKNNYMRLSIQNFNLKRSYQIDLISLTYHGLEVVFSDVSNVIAYVTLWVKGKQIEILYKNDNADFERINNFSLNLLEGKEAFTLTSENLKIYYFNGVISDYKEKSKFREKFKNEYLWNENTEHNFLYFENQKTNLLGIFEILNENTLYYDNTVFVCDRNVFKLKSNYLNKLKINFLHTYQVNLLTLKKEGTEVIYSKVNNRIKRINSYRKSYRNKSKNKVYFDPFVEEKTNLKHTFDYLTLESLNYTSNGTERYNKYNFKELGNYNYFDRSKKFK